MTSRAILDHLVVGEEEPGQAVLPDQTELLLQPVPDPGVHRAVLAERRVTADLLQERLRRVAGGHLAAGEPVA